MLNHLNFKAMKERKFIVSDILWDVDQTTSDEGNDSLPVTIEVVVTENDVDDINDDEEVDDYISDYITNQTGFCHGGFSTTEN